VTARVERHHVKCGCRAMASVSRRALWPVKPCQQEQGRAAVAAPVQQAQGVVVDDEIALVRAQEVIIAPPRSAQ